MNKVYNGHQIENDIKNFLNIPSLSMGSLDDFLSVVLYSEINEKQDFDSLEELQQNVFNFTTAYCFPIADFTNHLNEDICIVEYSGEGEDAAVIVSYSYGVSIEEITNEVAEKLFLKYVPKKIFKKEKFCIVDFKLKTVNHFEIKNG